MNRLGTNGTLASLHPGARGTAPALPRLYRIEEVVDILGASERTIWGWIRDKELKVVRLGKKCVRFHPDDVQEFINARRGR